MSDGFTDIMNVIPYVIVALFLIGIVGKGIHTIRPTQRAVVERLGKYKSFKSSGIVFVIPIVEKLYMINITETLTDIRSQVVITKDNLNAVVSAQIYHKIKEDEVNLKNAFYKVRNVEEQIVNLAQTTMRNVIGMNDFKAVNGERKKLNEEIRNQIADQTANWGVEIVRVELKEIDPPKEVQESMNSIIEANNLKIAAVDKATAAETEADGLKRANIKRAEGEALAMKTKAEGEANAITTVASAEATKIKTIANAEAEKIKVVNTALQENFKDAAVLFRQYEVNETSLKNNSKIIFTKEGMSPMIVIGDDKMVVPYPKSDQPKK